MMLGKAGTLISPNGDDWIVTIAERSGIVWTRRITPGAMTETEALRVALLAQGTKPDSVADATIRRAGSVDSIVSDVNADDPFVRLVERLRIR